jgi:hypothetical protein
MFKAIFNPFQIASHIMTSNNYSLTCFTFIEIDLDVSFAVYNFLGNVLPFYIFALSAETNPGIIVFFKKIETEESVI